MNLSTCVEEKDGDSSDKAFHGAIHVSLAVSFTKKKKAGGASLEKKKVHLYFGGGLFTSSSSGKTGLPRKTARIYMPKPRP